MELGFPTLRGPQSGDWSVISHSNDGAVSESGTPMNTTALLSSTGGSTTIQPFSGICFFELPPQPLVSTDMSLIVQEHMEGTALTNNIDLWGLGYQSSPSMSGSWYLGADDDTRTLLNGEQPVKIADNIASIGNVYPVGYEWTPGTAERKTLKDYINGLYDLGAKPGDYAVFRVNMDTRVYGVRYGIRWNDSSVTGLEPLFTGEFTPGDNLFQNPGMEEGSASTVPPWALTSNGYVLGQTNETPRTDNYCMIFGVSAANPGNGNGYVGATQSFTRDDWPGKKVTFSCYARHNSNDPISGSVQKMQIRLYFYDSNNDRISLIDSPVELLSSDATDVYKYLTVSKTVPAETAKITAQFIFRTGDPLTCGSVFVDDAKLEIWEPLPDTTIPGTIILIY